MRIRIILLTIFGIVLSIGTYINLLHNTELVINLKFLFTLWTIWQLCIFVFIFRPLWGKKPWKRR